MAKKKFHHYAVVSNIDGEQTAADYSTALKTYDKLSRKEGALVTLYGVKELGLATPLTDCYVTLNQNFITKILYIFYGSLSVLQILEEEGISDKVKHGMGQCEAFDVAQDIIKGHFDETGERWEYDLDLDVEVFRGKDEKALIMDAEHSIDLFEHWHDFEESDGTGNAQGFTAFTL